MGQEAATVIWEPGTTCRLSYTAHPGDQVEPGDFLRSTTGKCYMVDDARPSPSVPGRFNLRCTRLDIDAVHEGEPGVWPIYWQPRRRRRA